MAVISVGECRNFVQQFARNAGESVYPLDQIDRAIQTVGDEVIRKTRIILELDSFLLAPGQPLIGAQSADFRPSRLVEAYLKDGSPTVTFSGGGGYGAVAHTTVLNGAVTGVSIDQGGWGYASAPTATLSAPYGTGATATFTVSNGAVNGVTFTPGSGYASGISVSSPGPSWMPFYPFPGPVGNGTPGSQRLYLRPVDFMTMQSYQASLPSLGQPSFIAWETWTTGQVYPRPDQPYILNIRWSPMFTYWTPGDPTQTATNVNVPLDIMREALTDGAAAYLQNNDPTQRYASQSYQRFQAYLASIRGSGSLEQMVITPGRHWGLS